MSEPTQTTIDPPTNNQALINYDAEFAKIAAETHDALTQVKGSYISTKGKLFNFPDGRTESNFNCIVVDYIRCNTLLPPYNPNIRPNPKCWALGRSDHLLVPSTRSPQRQAESCAACALNKFGSATNGGKGKACSNTYRLAIAPPDATENSEIWLIKISPTGLARWTSYVKMADASFGTGGFCKIITNLSFDPNKDYPSIVFKGIDPIKDPRIIFALRRRASEEIMVEPSGE